MKFLCSHCKAKYQIADEKVAGRTLRMVCRRCQQEIVIRGEPQLQPAPRALGVGQPLQPPAAMMQAPVPSPLGADFQRQVAANLASPLPMPNAGFDEWHVAINDTPVGPMRREEVARKLAMGAVNGDSLAWREGMDDWMPLLQIPELAVLCLPRSSVAAPPPAFVQPAQRVDFSPLGGRAGASPYTLDSWQPAPSWAPPETGQHSQQMAVGPMVEVQPERRAQGPSWPAMFALACGFALLMSALTIVGAGWLRDSPQQAAAPATAGAPAPAPAQPTAAAPTAVAEAEPEGMIIGLDEVQGDERPATRPKTGNGSGGKIPPKKELTAAQREMLARMGGDTGTDLSGLGTDSSLGGQPKRAAGSLTAAEVTRVVQNGKKNLQRCYETAIRGSGSTDTLRVDVEFTVSASGNVGAIKIGGQSLPGMSTCLERTVKMWRFPASGQESPVKFPLVLQPGA